MKSYSIYIKSHCEAPDYEDEVLAENVEEASKKFWNRMSGEAKYDWTPESLVEFIGEDITSEIVESLE